MTNKFNFETDLSKIAGSPFYGMKEPFPKKYDAVFSFVEKDIPIPTNIVINSEQNLPSQEVLNNDELLIEWLEENESSGLLCLALASVVSGQIGKRSEIMPFISYNIEDKEVLESTHGSFDDVAEKYAVYFYMILYDSEEEELIRSAAEEMLAAGVFWDKNTINFSEDEEAIEEAEAVEVAAMNPDLEAPEVTLTWDWTSDDEEDIDWSPKIRIAAVDEWGCVGQMTDFIDAIFYNDGEYNFPPIASWDAIDGAVGYVIFLYDEDSEEYQYSYYTSVTEVSLSLMD